MASRIKLSSVETIKHKSVFSETTHLEGLNPHFGLENNFILYFTEIQNFN